MARVTEQELENAQVDVSDLSSFMNAAADVNGNGQITSRLGRSFKVLEKIIEDAVALSDPDDVQAALDLKADLTALTSGLAGKANTSHTHAFSTLTGAGDMARLGTTAVNVSDWDDVQHSGFYMNTANSASNRPPGGSNFYIGLATAYTGNSLILVVTDYWSVQTAQPYPKTWRRVKSGVGTWGDWERVYQTEEEIQELIDAASTKVARLPEYQNLWSTRRSGMVVMADGTVRGWGSNYNGCNGQGTDNTDRKDANHAAFPPGTTEKVSKIVRGGHNTWFIMDNGDVWTCGQNSYGSLGHGDTAVYYLPKKVSALDGVNIVDVFVGCHHTAFPSSGYAIYLASNGRAYACGYNSHGQLGLGDTTQRTTPTLLAKTDWSRFHCTGVYGHTVGIDTSGRLFTTGYNTNGQVGDGSTTQETTFTQRNSFGGVAITDAWVSSDQTSNSGASGVSLAVTSDGKLWAWGINNTGNLGLGDTTQRTIPTQVTAMGTDNEKVFAYAMQSTQCISVVQKTDGSVWGAGDNASGILGQGNVTDSNVFVEIIPAPTGGVTTEKVVFTATRSQASLYVLYSDGTIKVVGSNQHGQLGVGTFVQVNTSEDALFDLKLGKPVDVMTYGYTSETSLMVLTDKGDVFVCGYGGSNALSNTPASSQSTFRKVLL